MSGELFKLPSIEEGEDKTSPFRNCLRNTYRHLKKWAKRTHTNCFRIYDRELPAYPLAIDFYDNRYCIHYFSKSKEVHEPPEALVADVNQTLVVLLGANPQSIFWRSRAKTKPTRQYEKMGDSRSYFTVYESGIQFWVNLVDYLDTGLFLDHREMRNTVQKAAKGKKILNLFSYTGAFSVHAAYGGAKMTKSVDMSNTYSRWCEENFILNGFSLATHHIVRQDCLKFLDDEIRSKERYDMIILDPPTMSRSKKMDQLFEIQNDYVDLIKKGLKLLLKEGVIYFSTNSRKFSFDPSLFPECKIEEISHKTRPIDFSDPKIHRCWKVSLL